jgi:hypothetical protein
VHVGVEEVLLVERAFARTLGEVRVGLVDL